MTFPNPLLSQLPGTKISGFLRYRYPRSFFGQLEFIENNLTYFSLTRLFIRNCPLPVKQQRSRAIPSNITITMVGFTTWNPENISSASQRRHHLTMILD